MFCPKCGALLVPKKGKIQCPTHGPAETKVKITEKTKEKQKLIKAGDDSDSREVYENECPKCGHRKAYGWMVQTRAADEAPTRFYECKKCGHKWKEYS